MDENQEPKKYIRTLEGDIETLGKGGTPDLAPFREPTPSERLVAPSPVQSAVPVPVPGTKPSPIVPKTPQAIPHPAAPSGEKGPLKTYSGDFSQKMKETHASTATVLAAEQDSGPHMVQAPVAPLSKFSRSEILFTIAGVVLLIVGSTGAYFAYTRYLGASAPIIVAPTVTAPIFVDDRERVSGTGTALVQAIEQSVARTLTKGSVRLLYIETATSSSQTTTTSIFSALQLPAPNILMRNMNGAQSMAGVINVNGVQSPFFILSVASYGDTFSGMLRWESLMPSDVSTLFPSYSQVSVSTTSTGSGQATTITATSTPPVQLAFRDEVVSNHDVRVYRDSIGRSIVLYGYWNQTTLVIARDPTAFTEIIGRLATSRAQP